MLLFIYTSKQSGKRVEKATGIHTHTDTHTHCLCTYTYVTELTLVLTLWNDCEPSCVCVARFNAHARTTLKKKQSVCFGSFRIHQVLIAHVRPHAAQQVVNLSWSDNVCSISTTEVICVKIFYCHDIVNKWGLTWRKPFNQRKKYYFNRVVLTQPILLSAYSAVKEFLVFDASSLFNQH